MNYSKKKTIPDPESSSTELRQRWASSKRRKAFSMKICKQEPKSNQSRTKSKTPLLRPGLKCNKKKTKTLNRFMK